ncbi:hypothetical protein M413DRAFT_25419 [Hebeloma cylindrosporum]|uniref:Uncharacterized protein n=1 Tax=Hebeloma cylindrosporum TaxID=76867 RepID=A0A0C3CJG9_HEBCY|nr:hypothetical protein M413DRAFT_25419 [Hebeloma cylindrosporum h7]
MTNQTLGSSALESIVSNLPTHLHSANLRNRVGFDVAELHVELLCEIFERFVEDHLLQPIRDDTPSPLVSRNCRSDPTKLGQVCSRWRKVAINLPKLWSNILIHNPKPSHVYLTDVWLERSGNNPLNLEIYSGRNHDVGSAIQILKSFIAHLSRWKRFHLHAAIELLSPLSEIILSPEKPLILESVSLVFRGLFWYQPKTLEDKIWEYFHRCPTLRQVVWPRNFLNHAPSQLTHICARFPCSIEGFLLFLSGCPLIQELNIEDLSLPSNNPPDIAISLPLSLDHLGVLRIYSYNVAPASCFIASLTCPSLESLEINHCFDLESSFSNQILQELPRFLHRSGCCLQKLDLRVVGTNITDGELTKCLSDSPLQSLRYLHVSMDNLSDRMVGLLSRKSPTGLHEFAPFLEKLELPWCATTDGLLANMVSSRWHEVLDGNYSTSLGHLQVAIVHHKKGHFDAIDKAFFSANVLY